MIVKIFNKLRTYRLRLRSAISSACMYLYCRLYGIQLGKSCRFWNRTVFFRQPGAQIGIGDHCIFRSDFSSNLIGVTHPCIISAHAPGTKIKIGNNCAFSGVSIGAMESVMIGNNVQVGANTVITDFDWHSLDPQDRDNPEKIKHRPVILEDNVWIGASCTILKGVTIGQNSVVGSGSIVTTSLPPDTICGGNPCKVLKNNNK